jgi:hypothetical protein
MSSPICDSLQPLHEEYSQGRNLIGWAVNLKLFFRLDPREKTRRWISAWIMVSENKVCLQIAFARGKVMNNRCLNCGWNGVPYFRQTHE